MSTAPAFILSNVQRQWGERIALTDITLTIDPGERLALIGPSGSGKTTLLRLLMASLRSTSGTITVNSTSIATMTPSEIRAHRLQCALIDQDAQIIPRLSVHDNIIAGRVATWPWWRTLASMFWSFEKSAVCALLANVSLADRQWDQADQLSGGQRQRVAIARALAGNASLILADEPTAALDPATAAEVLDVLVDATQKRNATLVISTHRVSQVLKNVDRLIGLREGRIFFDEPVGRVADSTLVELYRGSRELA